MIFTTKGSGTKFGDLAILGAQFKDIKEQYNSLTKAFDNNSWEKAIKAPQNWSKATREELKKVRNAAKETQNELIATISESIDTKTDAGRENLDYIIAYRGASAEKRTQLLEVASKSMKDYIKTCEDGKPTWDGFVAYQQKMASSLSATGVKAKIASVGLNIFKAAAGMLVTVVAQFAIQKLIEGFDYLIHIEEKLAQKSKDAREQYKSTN